MVVVLGNALPIHGEFFGLRQPRISPNLPPVVKQNPIGF